MDRLVVRILLGIGWVALTLGGAFVIGVLGNPGR